VNAAVEEAISKYRAQETGATAPALARGLTAAKKLLDAVSRSNLSEDAKYNIRHELEIKRVQFNDALAEALGLSLSANVAPDEESDSPFRMDPDTFRIAIPGQRFAVRVRAVNQTSTPVALRSVTLDPSIPREQWSISAQTPVAASSIDNAKPMDVRFSVRTPENSAFTRPYFSRPDIEQSYYDILDEGNLNQPLPPYPLAAWAEFEYSGVPIRIGRYVQTTRRLTGSGTVSEPLAVGPAISVAIAPHAGIVALASKSFSTTVVVHSNVKGPAKGSVRLNLPTGWKSQPAAADFDFTAEGQDQSIKFQVTPANLAEKAYQIQAIAEYDGRRYNEGYQVTGYPGLRPYFLYRPATYRLTGVDVKTASNLRVGYVTGSGDDVPASLENLGVKPTFLGPAEIATGDLSEFDVLLLGVRTYAVREDLRTYNSRILEYVRNGGVLVVQYNTPEFDHNFGPYPYTMTSNPEEVTDEASKVQILAAANPIFNWPNSITERDFDGWVEERGSKWMKSWDPHYEVLIETHDEGQEPQKGGLLYAKYGKGIYIYNALAFYRQLPEGVPGAYRIFANIISLAKNPQR
jgi:hypothetical protein